MNLEVVFNYIKENDLSNSSRKQDLVYKRHYLCKKMYETGLFTLCQLGEIFNRHHAAILHSIRKHEDLKKDKIYQRVVEECANMFDDAQFNYSDKKRDIFEDIKKASNLEKLRRIRKWIKEGKYDVNDLDLQKS